MNKKVLIIVGSFVGVILLSWLFYSLIPKEQPAEALNGTVIIDNAADYSSNINEAVFLSIGKVAYGTMQNNDIEMKDVYHGVVRDDTFKQSQSYVSFILDIESEKISWKVSQAIDKSGNEFSDASVLCVNATEAIYPIPDNCRDINNGFQTTEQQEFMEMTKLFPLTGPTYSISYQTTNANELGYVVTVTTYTSTGRNDAIEAVKSLGFDLEKYPVQYVSN